MPIDQVSLKLVPNTENVSGRQREIAYDLSPSSQYPSGGYTVGPQRVGLKVINGVFRGGSNTAAVSFDARWNTQTGKLQVFSAATEVTQNTDLSLLTFRLKFEGE